MTAIRIGVVLSAIVVALGVIWSAAGYYSTMGTDVAPLFAAGAIFFGGIALAFDLALALILLTVSLQRS